MLHTQTVNGQAQSWKQFALVILALALAFAFVARQYLDRYSIPAASVIGIYLCFLLSLGLALAPAVAAIRSLIPALFPGRKKFFLLAIFLVPFLIYTAGTVVDTSDFRWPAFFRLFILAALAPLCYLVVPVRKPSQFCLQDALLGSAMLAAVLFRGLGRIFVAPANPHPINLDFLARLFLLAVASWTWTFLRPVPGLGYQFVFSKLVAGVTALNFLLFALIAIPTGEALHFIAWNPHWRGPAQFILDYLEIFLFIALLEELFFRGFLQNLLSRTFHRAWAGQLLASILFGLSHIFHAPVPNWRYVFLATIAGWFYGSAYRASGSLFASALTHALVDTAWRTFFPKI